MTESVRKYECHITCPIEHAERVQSYGEFFRFKFSRIDGDALMGAKPFCYLTAYDANAAALRSRMDGMITVLDAESIPVLRSKIEEVIYDTKTGLDNMSLVA